MSDRADDVDATRAGQIGGAAFGHCDVEVMRDAVVLNHGAVAVGAAVKAFAVSVGWVMVAE